MRGRARLHDSGLTLDSFDPGTSFLNHPEKGIEIHLEGQAVKIRRYGIEMPKIPIVRECYKISK